MTLTMADNTNIKTKHPYSYQKSCDNQENLNDKVKKEVNVNPKEKPKRIKLKNPLLNETPEQRELRLKRQREYRESRTPEQKEASRLKNALYTRRYREEQLNLAKTPEEREVLIQKRKEYSRNYREKLKSLAKTPEEKEALRLKIVIEKRRSIAKLKQLPDRDCMGRLCVPGEIDVRKRRRVRKEKEDETLQTLKKRLQATEKMRDYRRKIKNMRTIGQATEESSSQSTRNRMKDQIATNHPLIDEIKVEKEVLQETTIHTIPTLQNPNAISFSYEQQEACRSSSWSRSQSSPSMESFMIDDGSSKSYPGYSRTINGVTCSLRENLPSAKSHSTKIERRKTNVEKSLSCMRDLMNARAKGDRFEIFGKLIAQKLSSSKKPTAEINVAKLLIDNVLQNLAVGS